MKSWTGSPSRVTSQVRPAVTVDVTPRGAVRELAALGDGHVCDQPACSVTSSNDGIRRVDGSTPKTSIAGAVGSVGSVTSAEISKSPVSADHREVVTSSDSEAESPNGTNSDVR